MKVTHKLFKKNDKYVKHNYKSVSRYPLKNAGEGLERKKLIHLRKSMDLKLIVNSFLNRAYKVSSNWLIYTKEFDRNSQMLTNINFPHRMVENVVYSFANKK